MDRIQQIKDFVMPILEQSILEIFLNQSKCCLEENQNELNHRIIIANKMIDELKNDFYCHVDREIKSQYHEYY